MKRTVKKYNLSEENWDVLFKTHANFKNIDRRCLKRPENGLLTISKQDKSGCFIITEKQLLKYFRYTFDSFEEWKEHLKDFPNYKIDSDDKNFWKEECECLWKK